MCFFLASRNVWTWKVYHIAKYGVPFGGVIVRVLIAKDHTKGKFSRILLEINRQVITIYFFLACCFQVYS